MGLILMGLISHQLRRQLNPSLIMNHGWFCRRSDMGRSFFARQKNCSSRERVMSRWPFGSSRLAAAGFLILFIFPLRPAAGADRASAGGASSSGAKNVIVMVADGMGLATVTAARLHKFGPGGGRLAFEELPVIGYQSTYAADSIITDSAAAASAWACGRKFANGEICFHRRDGSYPPSLLEIARSLGKATGLVATSNITHATPAAFGAHVASRHCETEIARQYISTTRVDVLLGGGRRKFEPTEPDACGTEGDILKEAAASGYALVFSLPELKAALPAATRVLGLFAAGGLAPENRRPEGNHEPRLSEMTAAALLVLEKNAHGFFLLVEGSQIDWAGHKRDLEFMIGETLAFDEAVRTVRNWMAMQPQREAETLLVVLSDHETGGFAVTGPSRRLVKRGEMVEAGWATTDHTGTDTMLWSHGPGSQSLGRALDNTDLYEVLRSSMK
jgi:alkaline phosphatase